MTSNGMEMKKRSFFERLTGSMSVEEEPAKKEFTIKGVKGDKTEKKNDTNWISEENDEAELSIDLYQTPNEIIVETMVAGVRPEDLEISITRDTITIRGARGETRTIDEGDYFSKELYWGKFSRTIALPAEVEPEEVEAVEKHGLLTIKLKKIDKQKKNSVKVKSI